MSTTNSCPQVPLLTFLITSQDGDSTTSLSNLCQCFTTLALRICFLKSGLTLSLCSLRLFPLVLHPGKAEWGPILLWQQYLFFSAWTRHLSWGERIASAPPLGLFVQLRDQIRDALTSSSGQWAPLLYTAPMAAKKMSEQWESSVLWQQCRVSLRFIGNDKPGHKIIQSHWFLPHGLLIEVTSTLLIIYNCIPSCHSCGFENHGLNKLELPSSNGPIQC